MTLYKNRNYNYCMNGSSLELVKENQPHWQYNQENVL